MGETPVKVLVGLWNKKMAWATDITPRCPFSYLRVWAVAYWLIEGQCRKGKKGGGWVTTKSGGGIQGALATKKSSRGYRAYNLSLCSDMTSLVMSAGGSAGANCPYRFILYYGTYLVEWPDQGGQENSHSSGIQQTM